MNFHLEGQIVNITIPYVELAGQTIVPTQINAVLKDGEELVLVNFGSVVFDPSLAEARVIIPSLSNMLQGDELQEVRRLEVTIVHMTGTFTRSHVYAIEAEQSLQIMKNSFMTYDTAMLTSTLHVNLPAFVSAPEDRRRAALVEAFRRITELSMVYSGLDVDGDVTSTNYIDAWSWETTTADVFKLFPSHFKRVLRAAQLAEADELLQGNVVARKHAQGIVSETIGESSVTLRQGFGGATDGGIGATALALLSGYINRIVKIGRA